MHGNSNMEVAMGNMFQGINSTRGMRKEAITMLREGRREEADEIFRKLANSRGVAELAVSRVMEKLNVVLIQEPGVLVGVEEDVHWIQKKLMRLGVIYGYDFTEELMDVAYDFEDVIDDLLLRSAAKQRRVGNWGRCFLSIRIHKKLEMIKSKIPHLPPANVPVPLSSETPKYLEEMEWSPMFSLPSQNQLEINTAVSPLKEKLSALLDLKALHPDTKKKTRRVLDELESLGSFLRGLESIDLDDKALMVWTEKLSDVSVSAMVVIEYFINKNVQLRKRSWMVTSFGKLKSQKLVEEIDQLYAKIQNLSITRPREDSQTRSESELEKSGFISFKDDQPVTGEPDFASFADDVHAMTTRLLAADQSFRVIPIIGMQGIGKTTLAKLIFNNNVVAHHFPSRAWPSTTASSTIGDSRQILLDIIKKLMNCKMRVSKYGVCSSEHDEMMQKLKAFFTDNRCLIVMDDPSNFHYWNSLLKVIADTSNGSRMIWIARKMSIPPNLTSMSSTDPHPLRLRTDEESWAMFTHALKVSIPSELHALKKKIVRRCGGLPLLIDKFAELLSHKDATIEEWSNAIEQPYHDLEKVWSSTLYRIYKDLSLYMRRCLFSLIIFPPDFDIPTRRLITFWVAEDMVEIEDKNEAPEDVAERCLNLLIAQGMVQVANKKLNGNVKTVRLPHALRQYWLSKAQEATALGNHIYTRSELFPGNDMIRRLVDHLDKDDITFDHIHGGHNTSSTSLTRHYRDVLSFRSFDNQETLEPVQYIGNFIGRCISSSCFLLLQVLDLENVFRPKLPEALGKLTQLRYLGMRSTFLEKLPSSISKLQNLQTLDIKHTNINTLPDSIWELQQLRHLYLSEGYRSKLKPRPSIGCLTTLQTLCGLFIDEETPVRDGLNRLLNLRKLGLAMPSQRKAMSSQVEAITEWVQNLKHLRSLRVKSISEDYEAWDLELKPLTGHLNLSCIYLFGRLRNPSIVSQFPPSLIDLTLSGSELTEDPMQSLDKLPNLRSLKLYAKSYLGKSMHCSKGGFPQLRVLKLWNLDQLEEWKVEKGALQAIRDLEIRYSERPLVVPEELSDRSPLLKIDIVEPDQ